MYTTNEIYETAETGEETEKEVIWKIFGDKFFSSLQTRRQIAAYNCNITSVLLATVVLNVARHESVIKKELDYRIGPDTYSLRL